MLQQFEIQGIHTTVDENLRKYVNKKIGGMDRYLSRHQRLSAKAEVRVKQAKAKSNTRCTCEVTFSLPHETIVIKESAFNMFAAVDIVEVKLKQQLKRYKELHSNGKLSRHLFGRLRRNPA